MKALIVTEPFADYAKGQQITDASQIDEILVEHSNQVVVINPPDPPASTKDSAKTDPQT